jgi:Thaumatin family
VAEWTLQGSGNLDYYDGVCFPITLQGLTREGLCFLGGAVTLVNGFNLPMAIIPSAANCPTASCPIDLNPQCPAQLIGPRDTTGLIVGCESPCEAQLDNPGTCSVPPWFTRFHPILTHTADQPTRLTVVPARTTPRPPALPMAYRTTTTSVCNPILFSRLSSLPEHITKHLHSEGNCPNSYVYAFDGASGTALWTCSSAQASDYKLTFCPCVLFPFFFFSRLTSGT